MNPQAGQRRWGKSVCKKIVKRLGAFRAAESLHDIATIKGARLEKLLVPAPEKGEETLILEVIDYHE